MKTKTLTFNQFIELRNQRAEAKKPHTTGGSLPKSASERKPKAAKVSGMYDENGFFNASFHKSWL